jgi:AraC-like DNA-binding protein
LASNPVRVHSYSTADIAPSERYEGWRSHWPELDFVTEPLESFHVSSERVLLGQIGFMYTDISSQHWERSKRLADRGRDIISLVVNLDGKAAGTAGKREWAQRPGSGIVFDYAQTSIHDSAGGRSIGISIPRHLLAETGLDLATLHGLMLSREESAMFTSHAFQVREALSRFTEEDAPLLGRSMLDVFVLTLKAAGRTEAPAFREDATTLFLRAESEIRAHLESPALTIANLCRKLGVSRSSLHRAFEARGGVQTYIRDARLDAARHALCKSPLQERIGDIAERLGFSDAAHMSRLFKARFGESPSDCRANALLNR